MYLFCLTLPPRHINIYPPAPRMRGQQAARFMYIPVSLCSASCNPISILYQSWILYLISWIMDSAIRRMVILLTMWLAWPWKPHDLPPTSAWLKLSGHLEPHLKITYFPNLPQPAPWSSKTSQGESSSLQNPWKIHSWKVQKRTLLQNSQHWVRPIIYSVWKTSKHWNLPRIPPIILWKATFQAKLHALHHPTRKNLELYLRMNSRRYPKSI